MNTNFKVIGSTRLGIEPMSTASEADAITTQPFELISPLGHLADEILKLKPHLLQLYLLNSLYGCSRLGNRSSFAVIQSVLLFALKIHSNTQLIQKYSLHKFYIIELLGHASMNCSVARICVSFLCRFARCSARVVKHLEVRLFVRFSVRM